MNLLDNYKTFVLASLVPILLVLTFGDSMYIGIWYYILIPIVCFLIVSRLQPRPLFLSGIGIAIALTYMPFLISNWVSDMPEGFIVFWHLFSLPGIILGALFGAFYCNRHALGKCSVLYIGFGSVMAGFIFSFIVILIGISVAYS